MAVRTFGISGATETAENFRLAASGLFVPTSQINDRTGVTSTPVLTGTGNFTCTIGPFSCVVDGTSNALQGAYWATLDTAATVTVNAANTQARIDLISLQIQDNAYDSSGVNAGRILYTAGTPGSGTAPTAPANSISLFTVPVAANATSANFAQAVSVFPYAAAAGGIVPVRSTADKPAVVGGAQYRHRLDVTAGSGASPTEWSTDGITYTPVYDPNAAYGTWTNTTIGGLFSLGVQPQYRTAPGNRIELRGWLSCNSAIPAGTGVIGGLPLPSANRTLPLTNNSQPCYMTLITTNNVANVNGNSTSLASASVVSFDGASYSL
jgi:hypothetical protein